MCLRVEKAVEMTFPPAALVLLVMAALPGDLQVSCFPLRKLLLIEETALDMAWNSFDDQYKGCADLMEAELEDLNRTEFANNSVYAEAWEKAALKWSKTNPSLPPGLKPEYATAIMAYTTQGHFHRDFNAAVREAGLTRDYYLNSFDFKTFHFLLTRALQVLRGTAGKQCHTVYRGVEDVRFVPKQLQVVRFGHFTSTSLKSKIAEQFGNDTFFTIKTCYGVNIKNFSFYPGEEEVLIPPYETFKVSSCTKEPQTTFIHLISLEDSSVYNCVFVEERRCKRQPCTFNSGANLSPFSPSAQACFLLWGFLLTVGALPFPGLP